MNYPNNVQSNESEGERMKKINNIFHQLLLLDSDFYVYCLIRCDIATTMLNDKCSFEELDSAMYGQYIIDKNKYSKRINNLNKKGKQIVEMIIKKVMNKK